jgi:hypothetical protein
LLVLAASGHQQDGEEAREDFHRGKRLVVESDLRAATAADTELSENVFRRAKASEGGLKEIDSHESGKPEPVRAHIMSQREAGEDHGACEGADGVFEFHGFGVVEFV